MENKPQINIEGAFVHACLRMIALELNRVMVNKTQRCYSNPFDNTGAAYGNDVFKVEAYSWNDDYLQPWNFKWRDIEISWYKYLGRGMTSNVEITPIMASEMLQDCLEALWKIDEERDNHD